MVFFKTLQRVVRLFGGNGLSFVHARPIVATLQPLAMSVLATFAAELLARDAAELGARWQEQAPSFAPRLPERMALAGREEAERIVRVFADALREESHGPDAVMRAGWGFGAAAYAASLSLHYMLKEIDLLEAILLFACERAAESVEAPMSTASDGVAVARRLQRVRTLFTLAATKGFTRSYVEALQEQYRTLRHDLRNPLGTIKNAVSLMSDETVPAEQRSDPRFRQMVVRNATSMDATIGRRLSDSSALAPALAQQEVSLRDVALHVRRSLRDEAGERGCQVEVDASLPTVLTDSVSFELVLRSVTAAALRTSRRGATVTIGLGGQKERATVVHIAFEPADGAPRLAERDALGFAAELSKSTGGRVWSEMPGVVSVEVPVARPGELTPDSAAAIEQEAGSRE